MLGADEIGINSVADMVPDSAGSLRGFHMANVPRRQSTPAQVAFEDTSLSTASSVGVPFSRAVSRMMRLSLPW